MALPKEAQAALARALSAYIRATPTRELPGDLRRWKSWRPQTIASRSQQIVARLEDEGLRAQVRAWLDEKPSLPKKDARALKLAVERKSDWEEQVGALIAPPRKKPAADPEAQLRDRLAKEKEKTAVAKEELRKVKENARRAAQADKKRVAEISKELAAVRGELARANARIKELETATVRSRESAERQLRREKRAAEKTEAEKARLAEEARAARKEAAELRRGMRSLERQLGAAVRSARSPASSPRKKRSQQGSRKVLSAPYGLLEDAPDTLVAWLQDGGARLLVDGYNVSQLGFGDLSLADQRNRLLQKLVRLVRKYDGSATIVFDGSEVPPGTRRRPRGPVDVEYSSPDETADDHLVARLGSLPPEPVIVVTNDKELQERARAARATIATSDQLLALLR